MKTLKFAFPFVLLCLGIGFVAGSFMASPQLSATENQVVENTK